MNIEILEIPFFTLQKGGFLPKARLAYRTVGALNQAKDNAILVPSWFGGNDMLTEMLFVGRHRALNPEKYFIIMTNLLGNGFSSSPGNTEAPFDRACFPKITLHDNVRLQHALITEKLGIKNLRAIVGWSMGAMQVFQWASQFPDAVQAGVAIAGSSRTAFYNKLFLQSLRKTLELDPAFEGGFYSRPPLMGLKAFSSIYGGWCFSEPFFRKGIHRFLGANDPEQFIQNIMEPTYRNSDANGLLTQLATWESGDISENATYMGNIEAALAAIKARMVVCSIDSDRYFPPVEGEFDAHHIKGSNFRLIKSDWGHTAPFNPADAPAIDTHISEVL